MDVCIDSKTKKNYDIKNNLNRTTIMMEDIISPRITWIINN